MFGHSGEASELSLLCPILRKFKHVAGSFGENAKALQFYCGNERFDICDATGLGK